MTELVLDGHKLAWHTNRVQAWLDGENIAPVTIDCALTRRCNYKCVYCYGQLQTNEEKELSRDIIFRFLDDAAGIGVKAVSFVSDGESACSPHLYDAVKRGKSNGLDMALGTNGFLLKQDELEGLLEGLSYLRFNISAADPAAYARIMGAPPGAFEKVRGIIEECVKIKKRRGLGVTLGLQMVLMPQFASQIIPLARLGRALGVDYLVIKHCSDDECGSLGVDYGQYAALSDILKQAENLSDGKYAVRVKWSKILSAGKRNYSKCFGPAFLLQMSGSGLVAPCGMLFNARYKKYHIGNIAETRFKNIWQSPRYRQVMAMLSSADFDARTMCGKLCLQDKVNECLWEIKTKSASPPRPRGETPLHVNFV